MAVSIVSDLMTEDVQTIGRDDRLADAYEAMDRLRVRHLPVVDEDMNLIGLISHRDLVKASVRDLDDLPLSQQRDVLNEYTVGNVMITGVDTVDANDGLASVALRMLENKYGCVPVTEGLRLVGILTEADFVRHFVENN